MANEKTKNKRVKANEPKKEGKKSFFLQRLKARRNAFLARRPHRSFKRTSRRDYARSLKLPGYWAFTGEAWTYIWRRKRTFLPLVLLYALITGLFVGITSQETYAALSEALKESGGQFFSGAWWEIGHSGILLVSGITSSLSNASTDSERVIAIFTGLLMWLTTVWLLRVFMAGKKPRLRDALYSAGAPIVGTFCLLIVLFIQLIPLALAVLAFSAASTTGLIFEGVESMVFWVVEILLITVAFYWLASTLFALVIVTLPGMYPLRALKNAGDIVVGRRLRIFVRFIWLLAITFIAWVLFIIPVILFDAWLKSVWPAISWLPLVPICFLFMASLSVLWVASYAYMLYRKVVDDNAAPA